MEEEAELLLLLEVGVDGAEGEEEVGVEGEAEGEVLCRLAGCLVVSEVSARRLCPGGVACVCVCVCVCVCCPADLLRTFRGRPLDFEGGVVVDEGKLWLARMGVVPCSNTSSATNLTSSCGSK